MSVLDDLDRLEKGATLHGPKCRDYTELGIAFREHGRALIDVARAAMEWKEAEDHYNQSHLSDDWSSRKAEAAIRKLRETLSRLEGP